MSLVAEVQQNILWLKTHYNQIRQPAAPVTVALPSPVPSTDEFYEFDADADAEQRSLDLFENINRLTGITGFKVKAPNPEEPATSSSSNSGTYMLGIRFDVSVAGQYSIPHYIIIRQKPAYKPAPGPPSKGGPITTNDNEIEIIEQHDLHELEIFQHTIPAFLPVADLARAHLNTDLRQFAARVRASLVAHALRRHVFAHQLVATGGAGAPAPLLGRRVAVVESNQEYTRVRLMTASLLPSFLIAPMAVAGPSKHGICRCWRRFRARWWISRRDCWRTMICRLRSPSSISNSNSPSVYVNDSYRHQYVLCDI